MTMSRVLKLRYFKYNKHNGKLFAWLEAPAPSARESFGKSLLLEGMVTFGGRHLLSSKGFGKFSCI